MNIDYTLPIIDSPFQAITKRSYYTYVTDLWA